MEINLILGDCLEEMKNIPDESIDLILTDPPFGTTPCKWDSVIPFVPMWEQLNRIIKPKGAVCLFGTEPFSSALRMSNIKMFKYDWIWKKNKNLGANFAHAKNAPIRIVETISVFSHGKIAHKNTHNNRMIYNPQGLIDCNQKDRKLPCRINLFEPSRRTIGNYIRKHTNYPTNVLDIEFSKGERKNRSHPTQKPVALLEYLIKTYTMPNETVLDFTMGSGSTGVACINTGRKFIGIEKEEKYFKIAEQRIKDARQECICTK